MNYENGELSERTSVCVVYLPKVYQKQSDIYLCVISKHKKYK